MARRYDSADSKRRITSACVRLFIEKGYHGTKMTDILSAADVSSGTFQNIFHTKDGVLEELVHFMFARQFGAAKNMIQSNRFFILTPPFGYVCCTHKLVSYLLYHIDR